MIKFYEFVEAMLGKSSVNALAAMSDMHMENDDFLSWITQINRKLRQYHQYAISMAMMKHGLNRNFLPHINFSEPSPYDTPEKQKINIDANRRYNVLRTMTGKPHMKGSPFQNSFFETLGDSIEGLTEATDPKKYQGMSPSEAINELINHDAIKNLISGSTIQHLQDEMERYNGSENIIPSQTKMVIKRITDFIELFGQQINTWKNYYTPH